jgi:uncharacterized protein (TIGR03067 family)
MRWRIGLAACVALCAAMLIAADNAKDKDKKAADKIQGTYTVVSVVRDGEDLPDAKDAMVTYTADKYTVKTKDEMHGGTYTLDSTQKPKEIDSTPAQGDNKDKVLKGIYKLEGDTLTICMPMKSEQDRPKAFESKQGSGLLLVILKRQKD